MKKKYDLIILGAGPAGICTALSCTKAIDNVLIIDKNSVVGKKILSTGNGKCNLSNKKQYQEAYRSEDSKKAWKIIERYPITSYMEHLHHLGIYTRDKNGYLYPYSEQASTVRETLESALKARKNLNILTECEILKIRQSGKEYLLQTTKGVFQGKAILLSTGGMAAPKLGSDGEGYQFAKQLGHHIIKPLPALTALKSGAPFLKKVSGVRNQCKIALYVDQKYFTEESGELQWTDYGVSGVAIFQLSRYAILALEKGKEVSLSLDMAPDISEKSLRMMLEEFCQQAPYKTVNQLLHGLIPLKLCPLVAREAALKEDTCVEKLKPKDIEKICQSMKAFILRINGYMGFDKAQVTRGGIPLKEVDENLQSLCKAGLFFAGEILDVDGTCGGYNLQWAYSSGRAAAEGIKSYLNR